MSPTIPTWELSTDDVPSQHNRKFIPGSPALGVPKLYTSSLSLEETAAVGDAYPLQLTSEAPESVHSLSESPSAARIAPEFTESRTDCATCLSVTWHGVPSVHSYSVAECLLASSISQDSQLAHFAKLHEICNGLFNEITGSLSRKIS